MKQVVFLFLVFYAVERILETFWRREKIRGKIVAAYSLYLLMGTYVLIYLVTFWEWAGWAARQHPSWVNFCGMLMVLLSIAGRNWAIKTLGIYHSIQIEIRDNHELIRTGPYRLTRNPYYLSNIIEVFGLALAANGRLALLISSLIYVPLVILRMVLEEKALKAKFKDLFAAYEKRVPRILPGIF